MYFPVSRRRSLEVDPTPVGASIVLRDAKQRQNGGWSRPNKNILVIKIVFSNLGKQGKASFMSLLKSNTLEESNQMLFSDVLVDKLLA